MKFDKGGGSQDCKPTCATCGISYFRKCLPSSSGFFSCLKNYHKVRDYLTIEATCKEGKLVALNVPKDDAPNKRRFYAL